MIARQNKEAAKMYNVLICDDDKDIVNALKIYLSGGDYNFFEAYNGDEAVCTVLKNDIHLVLMDIMMPISDGISATAKIRETHNMPIILLTAKSEDSDKILGLNIGADDYITKPFSPTEVTARVASQLRRYMKLGGAPFLSPETYVIGGLELDDQSKAVICDGETVQLTPKEYAILKLLISSPGKVYSPKEIYRAVWDEEPTGTAENIVAVHIRHLREKTEFDPASPRYIKSVWGHGYIMEVKGK